MVLDIETDGPNSIQTTAELVAVLRGIATIIEAEAGCYDLNPGGLEGFCFSIIDGYGDGSQTFDGDFFVTPDRSEYIRNLQSIGY